MTIGGILSDQQPNPQQAQPGPQFGQARPSQPQWGQQPQPGGPQWAGPRQAPAPKKRRGLKIALGVVGAVVAIGVIGAVAGGGGKKDDTADSKPAAATTAPAATTTAASKSPAAAAKPVTVLSESGHGVKTTAKFTVHGDWDLKYTYDCASFGMQGNFAVMTGGDLPDVLVNEIGKKGGDVTHQHDGGTLYLSVNSECAWTLKVIDLP